MDQIIIRFLRGQATPEEEARLVSWRRASAANEQQFQETSAVWDATAPPAVPPLRVASADVTGRGGHHRLRQFAALAAMLLIGFAIGEFRHVPAQTPILGVGEFVTGAGELATARLSDGTVVRLAPRSRLRITESTERREVWLDGKAFFAVAASRENPFLVRTRAGEAHVLGTRFEVEVREEEFRVVVVEGRVNIGGEESPTELAAGQVARSTAGAPPTVIDHGDVAGLVAWIGGFLAFESTPLHQVAEELERRFDITVQIADASLAERTVTAWFGDQEIESVLAVICRIADAHCVLRQGVVSIEP